MTRRLVVPLALLGSACFVFRSVEVDPLTRPAPADTVSVRSPVKAHLLDGSTVVFRDGVDMAGDSIWGRGMRFDFVLRDSTSVTSLSLDSVVGIEAFRTQVDPVTTVLGSGFATLGAIGLGVAIFGSCPTYYSDSAGVLVLEAEGFSYSVAALFEARDVDRLRLRPDPDGTVRLEVRNEALETHYLNHFELVEVRHAADEVVLPDDLNRPVAVRGISPLARAADRRGRDVRPLLAASEGDAYRTDPGVLAAARLGDLEDAIDLTVATPDGADSVVVALRLRNSLLNTILFYDIMLGDPGARSLDWVGRDLQQVGPAVELAAWYQKAMGMRVAVRSDGAYREVTHLKDVGPIAWKDVAIVVPVREADSVRVRLSFPADNWRIDRIVVASRFRRPAPIVHALAEVRAADERPDPDALTSLEAPDQRYLETTAGQRFSAVFRAGAAPSGVARTFLLASQGYYTEWVRRGWLLAPRAATTFTPSDTALHEAIARWRVTQDTLEARFMATRVPVR